MDIFYETVIHTVWYNTVYRSVLGLFDPEDEYIAILRNVGKYLSKTQQHSLKYASLQQYRCKYKKLSITSYLYKIS
jgi:hypothetical protein